MSSSQHRDPGILGRAMGRVARELLGDPSDESGDELRFGTRGSLCMDLAKGTFFDHEAGVGGGVLELVMRKRSTDKDGALRWLRDRGHVPKPSERNIVARYPYTDRDGNLLFEVVRYDPKDFRQRRPDGAGGWLWKMAGVKRVIYRLPAVLAAIAAGKIIYVVEGEKSANALAEVGITATCSPGGANKFRREHAQYFNGADLVILPDNDQPGRDHAELVAKSLRSLHGRAKSVRILPLPGLPDKGDVFDWLAVGGTVDELERLAREAPENPQICGFTQDAVDLSDITEDGAAVAFTERHKDQLRYCHHAQHWFVWTGSYWRREESRLAFSWARQVAREIGQQADDKDRVKVSKAAFAAAVERFAQSDRAFAVTADTWDTDPWLLGTPDGAVDLRTGALREAKRDDLITKRTSVVPAAPGAPHPVWSEFLNQATGNDKELQAFLQRLTGYCLTGDVSEEALAFLYGEGGTGKGTFLGAIVAVMGDYAVAVPIEVFTAGTRLNLEYYRAQMAGARLVTASETEAGASWAESQIKEMTGNETPLSARQPYGKPFTFRPAFKITLVGNHAPRLKGRSKAMERRMRIAPFKHKPEKPDHSLKDRLRAEQAAILRWIIDGCMAWQKQGLGTCPAVAAETDTYFQQQDHFGRWLSERCNVVATMSERPGKMLADFAAWARDSGEATINSAEFRELIERTPGMFYVTVKGLQWVRGVGLKSQTTSGATHNERAAQ